MDADFFTQMLTAIQGRNWIVLAGLVLVGVVYAIRQWGSRWVPWFKTDRGGAALALLIGVIGALGATLARGTVNLQTLLDGLYLGFTTAGGYAVVKKILAPSDVPKPISG